MTSRTRDRLILAAAIAAGVAVGTTIGTLVASWWFLTFVI